MAGVLLARRLAKTYRTPSGDVPALRAFDHRFAPGRLSAIVGPSGSGKSTLLNLLAGFDVPTAGEVLLDEVSLGSLAERDRSELRLRAFGFVFQSYNLLSVLSAEQNVAFPMGLAGVPAARRTRRAAELLDAFGLAARRHDLPHRLSGGERQRVALARALANDPRVVFADEPTGNLDSRSGALVLDALHRVAGQGRTVIVVTHDRMLARRADVRLNLFDGRLERVDSGAPAAEEEA